MPRPDAKTLATARKAATYLTEQGQNAYADAVTKVIDAADTSSGSEAWTALQELPIVTFWVPVDVHQALQGRRRGALADDVRAACREFAAGQWAPGKPARAKRGQSPKKKSMSTRIEQELADQVATYGTEHADDLAELGWAKAPTPGQLAELWLTEHYTPQDQDTAAE
jgi:hypothetical protein